MLDRESPFFLQRIGLVGLWLAVSLASAGWALSGGESNDLGAELRVVDTGFGIAIAVKNGSQTIWERVEIELDGKWVQHKAAMRPQERYSIQVRKFQSRKDPHLHPAADQRPHLIEVKAASGSYKKSFK